MDFDALLAGFIADRQFGQDIRQRCRIEQRVHDIAARLNQAADPIGEIVRQRMGMESIADHGEHPLFETGTGRMQAIIDGHHRQAQEGSDVLTRAFIDKEQRRRLAQLVRQFRNRCERGRGLPPLFENMIRQRLVIRQRFSFRERHGRKLLSPQHAKGMMPNNAPQPARERCGIGETRQGRPCRDEGLLNHVLGVLKVADQGQCRTERKLLETPGQFDKCLDVALSRFTHQLLVIHGHALSLLRCHDRRSAFKGAANIFVESRYISQRSAVLHWPIEDEPRPFGRGLFARVRVEASCYNIQASP